MKKQINLLKTIIFLLITLLFYNYSFAKIIRDDQDNIVPWDKSKEAYRPSPIVFSHGFAAGTALTDWAEEENQPVSQRVNMDKALSDYFGKYYCNTESGSQKPILALKDTTRFPYLELVSYIDFSKNQRSQLIDRNSSVDTYKMGDYYVYHYERNPGDPGWADKLNSAMEKVQDNYTDKNNYPLKANIICHSMGGLAAREYLTNSKYGSSHDKVNDLVLIGVPNLGSNLATVGTAATKTQEICWFIPQLCWIIGAATFKTVDKGIETLIKVDSEGDAARDMDKTIFGSGFLKTLNSRSQPANINYYAICGVNKGLVATIIRAAVGTGDNVVSKESQLGTGVLNLKDSVVVPAGHGDETRVIAQDNASLLIKFLDSEKPIVEITEPDPQSITETYENSIKIKGKVSREYLPADSILTIEGINEDTGKKIDPISGRGLYPSDLWVPNDPNSVVAEFEQEIPLTAPGKYKITCKVQNPAKVTSEEKEVYVKKLSYKPIIEHEGPTGKVGGPGLTIQANIYSPNGTKIDTSSLKVILDGKKIPPIITLIKDDSSSIRISYTPVESFHIGVHTVSINVKDINKISADEKNWNFEVSEFIMIKITAPVICYDLYYKENMTRKTDGFVYTLEGTQTDYFRCDSVFYLEEIGNGKFINANLSLSPEENAQCNLTGNIFELIYKFNAADEYTITTNIDGIIVPVKISYTYLQEDNYTGNIDFLNNEITGNLSGKINNYDYQGFLRTAFNYPTPGTSDNQTDWIDINKYYNYIYAGTFTGKITYNITWPDKAVTRSLSRLKAESSFDSSDYINNKFKQFRLSNPLFKQG